jgi:hypothetical protein
MNVDARRLRSRQVAGMLQIPERCFRLIGERR